MMPLNGDLIARGLEACKEVLVEMENIPDLDSNGHVRILLSEEFIKKGKKLKAMADSKLARPEAKDKKAALIEYVYSGLHFYHAAEELATTESQPSPSRNLLLQTGNFLIGCSNKSEAVHFPLTRSLLMYFAAVCYGRAFAVHSGESHRMHKAAFSSLRASKPVAPDLLNKVLETTSEAYKSLEWYRAALNLAQMRLEFPHDLMLQSFKALEAFIDHAVQSIHQSEQL